jgi:hypothetical protein
LIALFVSTNLVPPEFGILFRLDIAPGATVQKAAVHKYSQSFLGENEVGFAR